VAATAADKKLLLHVGCGPAEPSKINPIFRGPDWQEVRVDIDPQVQPDIVASIADLGSIPDAAVDAVWSSHNLEHLFAHEVVPALREFRRVLKPGGVLLVTLPDLDAVARVLVKHGLDAELMVVRGEKIRPLDVIFGWGRHIAAGRTYMAHKTGFTSASLSRAILAAGFPQVQLRGGKLFDLWALAYKDHNVLDRELIKTAIG
jgi:SAM-dependent methyltransferase